MQTDQPTSHTRAQSLRAQLAYVPQTLRLVWAAAPRWTGAWAVLLVIQGLLPALTVYLTKLSVDSLVQAIGTGGDWQRVQPAVLVIALTAGALLLSDVLQGVIEWIRTAQSEFIQDHIAALIHRQSLMLDIAFYESPEYYDRLDQVRSEAGHRSRALLESGGMLVQNGITLIAMAGVLIPYGAWLPLVLLVGTLPAFYVVLRFDRRYHQWWQRSTADRRRAQYYDMLLTHSSAAAEVRLFDLGSYFQVAYQRVRQHLRAERLRQMQAQSLARIGAGLGALLVSGGVMTWMVWRAFLGLVTLGDLVLFYQAFGRGQSLMRALLGSVGQLYNNTLFVGNLFSFLDMQPTVVDPAQPRPVPPVIRRGIRFRDITFRYPGCAQAALQDFNLTVPAGKIVAIVGTNGAGKTTLVKLLCRFYDPQSGCIELDGVDIRAFAVKDLWRLITVLFQFPLPYQATAGQNIAFGDVQAQPGMSELERAARLAGAHELITRLPQGYATHLGKWFAHGVELSGGEWQRIAMARAYLRQAQVIVLDEPTSAMDSWSETAWFERFRVLARGRTGIIITHRFTIAMRADIIHVMDGGRIVESGSHAELLAQEGLYAQSWAAQMQAGTRFAET